MIFTLFSEAVETVQPVTCRGVKPLRVSADFVCMEEKAVNTRLEIGELSALLFRLLVSSIFSTRRICKWF